MAGEGKKKEKAPHRFLSATFADIPAPELEWEQMPSAPVPRLDGYAVQIKNIFYVFSGYGSLDYVSILFPYFEIIYIFKCLIHCQINILLASRINRQSKIPLGMF